MKPDELPFEYYFSIHNEVFEKHIKVALLKIFHKTIRDNYAVTGYSQMQNKKWVIHLERTLESFLEKG